MRSEGFACPKCKDFNTRLQNAAELGQDRVHIRVRDLDSTQTFKGGVVEASSRSFVSVRQPASTGGAGLPVAHLL